MSSSKSRNSTIILFAFKTSLKSKHSIAVREVLDWDLLNSVPMLDGLSIFKS